MTTEIVLEINRPDDLSRLIAFLEKSGIAFRQRVQTQKPRIQNTLAKPSEPQNKKPLSAFIGAASTLDSEAFHQYLEQSRSEWERDIF